MIMAQRLDRSMSAFVSFDVVPFATAGSNTHTHERALAVQRKPEKSMFWSNSDTDT